MRYLPRALLAGGVGFAVSCLAACGGGPGLLSGQQSGQLQNQLNQISTAVSRHNCGAAATQGQALGTSVSNLPVTVNPTLRRNLTQGASVVYSNAIKDCQRTTPTTSTATTPTTTTTTPTTTTPTTTTPTTTTTTPTTTPTTTTPTTTTPTTPPTTPPTTTSQSGGGGVGPGGGGGQ